MAVTFGNDRSNVTNPDTYRKAADVIRTGGLAKGNYHAGERHCVVGALAEAKGVNVFDVAAETIELARMLGTYNEYQTFSVSHFGVSAWNDRDETTRADVITLLEQAAEKLEAEL